MYVSHHQSFTHQQYRTKTLTMTKQLSGKQSELVNKIAFQNGFTDFKVDTSPGSAKGDNYLGIITKIIAENKDGRKLELILKSASSSKAFRKDFPIRETFSREIYIYEKLFVEFENFQDEYSIPNPFSAHPKFYGSSLEEETEWLLMENILQIGFSMWDRKKLMKPELIETVFIEYAKFHAISLAMQQMKPNMYRELTKEFGKNDDHHKTKRFFETVLENGSKALANEPKMLEKLKRIGAGMDKFREHIDQMSHFNIVVVHADSWCNNMMFRYETSEETTQIPKVCFLDWQLAKKASPAEDLTYFFLAHSPKEVLYDYKHYLKLYHKTICKNLRDFSCDPEAIFPYSLLELHWKMFIHYGLYRALIVIKIMCCDSDEVLNFDEISDSGGDIMSSLTFDLRNASGYSQRIKDIMQFLDDNDLIDIDYSGDTF